VCSVCTHSGTCDVKVVQREEEPVEKLSEQVRDTVKRDGIRVANLVTRMAADGCLDLAEAELRMFADRVAGLRWLAADRRLMQRERRILWDGPSDPSRNGGESRR
jgi:hypothetical protein